MIKRCGYKFRLDVDADRQTAFWRQAGCARFVWNLFFQRQEYRRRRGHHVESYAVMCKILTAIKPHFDFLKDADSTILQQALKDLHRAYSDGFDKSQPHKRLPKLKKKHACRNSFRYTGRVKIEGRRVYLPKLGWVKFRQSRDIPGTLKNTTVGYEAGHWHVSFQTEEVLPEPVHPATAMVGVDLGVERLATLSSGWYVEGIDALRARQSRLTRLQRQLARKKKFSNNWRKAKQKITDLHRKIANTRRDILHKLSTYLSKNHAMIVLENLAVKNLSASARGTRTEPGNKVKQKAGLNKAILEQGFGYFKAFCHYKQQWRGGEVLLINPAHTSQTCAECGHCEKSNRPSQAVFDCQRCSFSANADDNASWNILAAGHAVLACGESALADLVKQEPVRRVSARPLLIN